MSNVWMSLSVIQIKKEVCNSEWPVKSGKEKEKRKRKEKEEIKGINWKWNMKSEIMNIGINSTLI